MRETQKTILERAKPVFKSITQPIISAASRPWSSGVQFTVKLRREVGLPKATDGENRRLKHGHKVRLSDEEEESFQAFLDFSALFHIVPEAVHLAHSFQLFNLLGSCLQLQGILQGIQRRTDIIQFGFILFKFQHIVGFPFALFPQGCLSTLHFGIIHNYFSVVNLFFLYC